MFNGIWHDGLLHNLQRCGGLRRNIWLNHIVSNKPCMKVIFKEHASSYFHINAGSLRFLSLYLRCFLFSSTTFSISSFPIFEFIVMTTIYSCLSSKSDKSDNVKQATVLKKKNPKSVVSLSKECL